MFRKTNKSVDNGFGRAGMPTIIGADFRVKGDISCEGDIQLEGTVDGNIKSLRLTVGETGVVQGDVNADDVRVHGKVVGTIRAKTVALAGTGHVTGDIIHETLSVDSGAFLNGHCRRMTDAETKSAEVTSIEAQAEKPAEAAAAAATDEAAKLTLVAGSR
jgi:cytoskeletal protein CcmA (bactofilin family)